MKEEEFNFDKIGKIGPLYKIEGIFFKHPFVSSPFKGFDDATIFRNSEPFLKLIFTTASDWFKKFPNCCDTHREISQLENFNKEDFGYIPLQILNNVKYFAHSLEIFIGEENGMNEIKDYLDYLIESLGMPAIGGHIFISAVKNFLEDGTLDNKEFTVDQRLELLEHLEPKKPPLDIDERDLDVLYTTFQKWLKAMPNIGGFKQLKDKLTGKIPMNIFIIEPKYNKYLGISSFRTRSRAELIDYLIKMTNDILFLSRAEIKKENYNKEALVLAAEEKLRVQYEKLLRQGYVDLEISYLDLVEKWLSMVIEFYQVLNQAIGESKNAELLENMIDIKSNTNDILSKMDELQLEISSFCNSDKVLNWLKIYLSNDSFKQLIAEVESLDENDEKGKQLLDALIIQIRSKGTSDIQIDALNKKISQPEIAIKHKLKLSIPLFLATSYEVELELSDKQKLPKSFKELRSLLFKK